MEGYIAAGAAQNVPCHPESERSVLGAMLRSREAALLAIETLQPGDFYDPANREIYAAMQTIAMAARPIDLVTLDEELTRRIDYLLSKCAGRRLMLANSDSCPPSVTQHQLKLPADYLAGKK